VRGPQEILEGVYRGACKGQDSVEVDCGESGVGSVYSKTSMARELVCATITGGAGWGLWLCRVVPDPRRTGRPHGKVPRRLRLGFVPVSLGRRRSLVLLWSSDVANTASWGGLRVHRVNCVCE
jgi:hypothetical protein